MPFVKCSVALFLGFRDLELTAAKTAHLSTGVILTKFGYIIQLFLNQMLFRS